MSIRHRPPGRLARGPAPWSFWLWSAGAWIVLAAAVFRGDAGVSGPRMAGLGAGMGFGDRLVAGADGPQRMADGEPSVAPALEAAERPSAADQAGTLMERGARWHSLRPSLREGIDAQRSEAADWEHLVVGAAGEVSGSAADLRFRERGAAGVELPHFVIGNGSRSGDGMIEATGRQLAGSRINILLIGGAPEAAPTRSQLRALTELIDYLRAKVGVIPVRSAFVGERAPWIHGIAQAALDRAFNESLTVHAAMPAGAGAR